MGILDFLLSIDYMYWLAFGIVFFIIELLTFTTFFLWLAFSAMFVAFLNWAFNTSGEFDLIAFSILTLLSLVASYLYLRNKGEIKTEYALNDRLNHYLDRKIVLKHDLPAGISKIKIDDVLWKVESSVELKKGEQIKIVSVRDSVFIVEKV